MEWFKFHTIWGSGLNDLSDAEAGRFLKAVCQYVDSGEIPSLSGNERFLLSIALKQLKQDAEHTARISSVRAEARRGKGLNSEQLITNVNNCSQMITNENKNNNCCIKSKNKNKEKETEKDIESLSADAQKPAKPKPEKHQHGSFKNVLLTDAELEKLHERFPDADKRIESFSVKKAAKGYVYKSDYAAIIAWAGDDGKKQQQQAQAKKTYTAAEVAEMIDRGEL